MTHLLPEQNDLDKQPKQWVVAHNNLLIACALLWSLACLPAPFVVLEYKMRVQTGPGWKPSRSYAGFSPLRTSPLSHSHWGWNAYSIKIQHCILQQALGVSWDDFSGRWTNTLKATITTKPHILRYSKLVLSSWYTGGWPWTSEPPASESWGYRHCAR